MPWYLNKESHAEFVHCQWVFSRAIDQWEHIFVRHWSHVINLNMLLIMQTGSATNNEIYVCIHFGKCSQMVMTFKWTSIRHQSNTFASDQCLMWIKGFVCITHLLKFTYLHRCSCLIHLLWSFPIMLQLFSEAVHILLMQMVCLIQVLVTSWQNIDM